MVLTMDMVVLDRYLEKPMSSTNVIALRIILIHLIHVCYVEIDFSRKIN
jgi:hypothetical protein